MSKYARLLITTLFVWIFLGMARLATASEDWPPVSPEDLKMTAEPLAPGAPAIYLYRQVDQDDRSGREAHFVRIKVLTEEGRKFADIEIPFVKQLGQVRDIKARTRQPDGTTAEFNGKAFEKTIVKAKGVKVLAKTFTLPDVRVGTIIEYSYSLEGFGYQSVWILSADLFTKRAKFSLKASSYLGLRWSWPIGLPDGTKPPVEDRGEIRMETQNVSAYQVEDFMPPENTVKYRVEFFYTWGRTETDQEKFWKQQGTAWYEEFADFTDKRKAMEQAVAQIVSPGDAPETKLQKIYQRVQQIRNTTFDRNKTAQEEKREKLKDTNNVEDVWKRGYGNSLVVNWLYIALVRAAGFEAYSVRVSSRNAYFFTPGVFNTRQLNTDVVLVKSQGKDIFLDPGSKFAPFGLLPWYETQVQGMLLDKDGGKWVQTSIPASTSARIDRKADLTMSEEGDLDGKLTVTFEGLEALELRMDERDEDDTTRKTELEDMVKESVPVGTEVELTNKPDWSTASPTMVAEYHLRIAGWAAGAGRRSMFPVGLFGNNEKHVFEHADRTYAVYFHHPYLKSDDINITLPSGWKINSVPNPIDQDAKSIAYTLTCEDAKGSLHIRRTLRSDLLMVPKPQYPVLRQFFQLVRSGDEQQVVLLPQS